MPTINSLSLLSINLMIQA